MHETAGAITIAVAGGLLILTVWRLRPRMSSTGLDVLLALEGAAVGIGGLFFLDDVGLAAWILTPIALATIAVLHVKVLFAGSGPLRI
jgi:predicted membrane-bound mannosyltransferase